jgi:hypothetical protein
VISSATASKIAFNRKLDALGYSSYDEYLRSAHWKRLREAHRRWSGEPTCFCGETDGLQLHHLTYERLGEERMADLRWLCKSCHNMVHHLERRRQLGIDLDGLEDPERAERYAVDQEPIVARARAHWKLGDGQRDKDELKSLARQIKSLQSRVPPMTDLKPFYDMVRAEMAAVVERANAQPDAPRKAP